MKIISKRPVLYSDLKPGDVFKLSSHSDAAVLMKVEYSNACISHVNLSTGVLINDASPGTINVFKCDAELHILD